MGASSDATAPAIFISYAHEDRAVAHEVAFGLQKRGCDVWIDQGELKAGDSLVERLAAGISGVDLVIAVISQHSVTSSWCKKELSLAVTQELDLAGRFGVRRVLPLRLGDVMMPPALRDRFYLEVRVDRPGDIVPRLWEDIVGHSSSHGHGDLRAPMRGDVERLYERGRNLYDQGELVAARRHLSQASQEGHHGAALLLGEILYDKGDIGKAADEWQFAAASPVRDVSQAAVVRYGQMLVTHEFSGGRGPAGPRGALIGGHSREQAEAMWRAAAESDQHGAPWAAIGLGRLLEDPPPTGGKTDMAGAEEAYEFAARSGHVDSHACALAKLGRIKWKLGKPDEAISILTAGATSNDSRWAPQCAFDLGRLHWDQRNDTEAEFWWCEVASSDHPQLSEAAKTALEDPNSIWRTRS